MSLHTWLAEETHLVHGEVYPRTTQVPLKSSMYKQINNTILLIINKLAKTKRLNIQTQLNLNYVLRLNTSYFQHNAVLEEKRKRGIKSYIRKF